MKVLLFPVRVKLNLERGLGVFVAERLDTLVAEIVLAPLVISLPKSGQGTLFPRDECVAACRA